MRSRFRSASFGFIVAVIFITAGVIRCAHSVAGEPNPGRYPLRPPGYHPQLHQSAAPARAPAPSRLPRLPWLDDNTGDTALDTAKPDDRSNNRTADRPIRLPPVAAAVNNRQPAPQSEPLKSEPQSGPGGVQSSIWWDAVIQAPLYNHLAPVRIDLGALNASALRHSTYVKIANIEPQIFRTEITRESAAFDWRTFLESTYSDANDPVGSTLTTGNNADRYLNRTLTAEGGVRQRNQYGGELQLSQQAGTQRDNSTFLTPNGQRTTRLQLQYTQPLLAGSGRKYNESRVLLAQIQYGSASDANLEKLQQHLVKVTAAYWELYYARSEYAQRKRALSRAQAIQQNLLNRQRLDADQRQVLRANIAVARRKTEIIRSLTSIRNAESQIRLLVNDPAYTHCNGAELMPVQPPQLQQAPVELSQCLNAALMNRPDIAQAIQEVRAAAVELGVSQNEILPRLDLVASGYVAGLVPESDQGQAFAAQFRDGRPGFSLGFIFESPFGNRAAAAVAKRRKLQLARAMQRYKLAVEESLTDVEMAVREVHTTRDELAAQLQQLDAASREASYLWDRWQVLPGLNDNAASLLENLLDSYERLAESEQVVARTQINHANALVNLRREMGVLLRKETR